jgi:hypothetical protein
MTSPTFSRTLYAPTRNRTENLLIKSQFARSTSHDPSTDSSAVSGLHRPERNPVSPSFPRTPRPACHSCHAPIIWTAAESGKKMPVDADPVMVARGFRIDETLLDEAQMGFNEDELRPGKDVLATFTAAPAPNERLYQSHFATCPDAAQHRSTR